ncbi:MAG: DUF6491 family protein [Sphingomonadales bacterium]
MKTAEGWIFPGLVSLIAGVMLLGTGGVAAAADDHEDAAEIEVPAELEAYERTGKMVNCVDTNRVRNTRVLDNQHIIFEMRGGRDYLNTLPYRCSQLGFNESFSYTLRGFNKLCNVDFITVITGSGPGPVRGASCGLGQFELIEKKDD